MPVKSNGNTKEKLEGISSRVVIILAVFTLLLLTLLLITKNIILGGEKEFDSGVFAIISRYTSSKITPYVIILTFFGSTKFLLPAYILLVVYFLFKKNTIRSFNIASIGITSVALLYIIKNIFKRHRPPHPLLANVQGFSYPSGHSFSAFTFCGILIYILWNSGLDKIFKWIGTVALFLFATLVAVSRVYLHVHYASDVIAGFCLSFVWLTLCIYVLQKLTSYKQTIGKS